MGKKLSEQFASLISTHVQKKVAEMFIKTILFCAIWMISLNIINSEKSLLKTKRKNSFVQYIREKVHQIMFLHHDQGDDLPIETNNFMRKIIPNVALISATFDQVTKSKLHIGNNPRETTIFTIVINSNFNSTLFTSMKMIKNISASYTMPKFLIVHFTENHNVTYERTLKFFWKNQFLDVTILQFKKEITKISKQTGNIPSLHQFNPYSNIYKIQQFKNYKWNHINDDSTMLKIFKVKSFKWFPDKGRNLYQKKVKYISAPPPPYFVTFRGLSQYLNFSLDPKNPLKKVQYGRFHCYRSSVKGRYIALLKKDADFISTYYKYYHRCPSTVFLRSRVVYLDNVIVIVPKSPLQMKTEIHPFKIILLVLKNFFAIAVLKIISLNLKFSKETWEYLDIFLVTLGGSFSVISKSFKERIVLIIILFAFIVYSGEFHSLLTEMNFEIIPRKEINTIHELFDSNLTIWGDIQTYSELSTIVSKEKWNISEMEEKVKIYRKTYRFWNCFVDLFMYNNVSCTAQLQTIETSMRIRMKKKKSMNAKFLESTMGNVAILIYMQPGLPYYDNFNKGLQIMIESGLISKWGPYKSIRKISFPSDAPDRDGPTDLLQRLILILLIGHISASLVFIGELIGNFYTKSFRREMLSTVNNM